MVQAMIRELGIRAEDWRAKGSPRTIYFGGGTPSVLNAHQIERLIHSVKTEFPDSTFDEITLEANPEDLNANNLMGWLKAGVDRLSVGVQTFDDSALLWMGRTHTGVEAAEAISLAANLGFQRMTLDLMYGLPGRDLVGWNDDLMRAMELPINHLSAYLLTVEPRTVLGARVAKGLEREAPESLVEAAYLSLCNSAQQKGWDHYEVSNFAQPGGHAVHNARYWEGVPYLGIGPGAHGFDGENRYANRPNNPNYLRALSKSGTLPAEWDILTPVDRYNERIMTGLRTARGIDLDQLESQFNRRPDQLEQRAWDAAVARGDLQPTAGNQWRIPEDRWLIGDAIASDLFTLED